MRNLLGDWHRILLRGLRREELFRELKKKKKHITIITTLLTDFCFEEYDL